MNAIERKRSSHGYGPGTLEFRIIGGLRSSTENWYSLTPSRRELKKAALGSLNFERKWVGVSATRAGKGLEMVSRRTTKSRKHSVAMASACPPIGSRPVARYG